MRARTCKVWKCRDGERHSRGGNSFRKVLGEGNWSMQKSTRQFSVIRGWGWDTEADAVPKALAKSVEPPGKVGVEVPEAYGESCLNSSRHSPVGRSSL